MDTGRKGWFKEGGSGSRTEGLVPRGTGSRKEWFSEGLVIGKKGWFYKEGVVLVRTGLLQQVRSGGTGTILGLLGC